MHPILERLKERKLVQWAVAYAAGAVALYSALDAFAEPWGVGDLQLRLVQVALFVGFFIALTLAWYHGERGEQRVTGVELLILAGIMGLGGLGVRLVADPDGDTLIQDRLSSVEPARFPVPFLPGEEPTYLSAQGYSMSPGGDALVYQGGDRDSVNVHLRLRRWSDLAATSIPGTEGGAFPDVSANGQMVAFHYQDTIRVADVESGSVRLLGPGLFPKFGDNESVYATVPSGVVRYEVEDNPSDQKSPLVTELAGGESEHRVTDVLASGAHALLSVELATGDWDTHLLELETGERRPLLEGTRAKFISTGHLVFRNDGGRMAAVRFDERRGQLVGEPITLPFPRLLSWSLSRDGALFYSQGLSGAPVDLGTFSRTVEMVWVDRQGLPTPVDEDWTFRLGGDNSNWRISPDGSKVTHTVWEDGDYDVWLMDTGGGAHVPLTRGESAERVSAWGPRSGEVTYLSDQRGNRDVWVRRADRLTPPELILDFPIHVQSIEWSPDGQWLVFRAGGLAGVQGGRDLYAFRPGQDVEAWPLIADPDYGELNPAISPNGRFIAYQSGESGVHQIEVRPFPAINTGRWVVSSDGGRWPRWAPSGGELFYQGPDREMMAVDVATEGTFSFGSPTTLFEPRADWVWMDIFGVPFDVHPDGQRFLIARMVDSGASEQVPSVVMPEFWRFLVRELPN